MFGISLWSILAGIVIGGMGLLYNYVYDPFGLSERKTKSTPPKLDNKSGMSPWAWTQRINAEPVGKGFMLQVEDKRASKTAVGVPMVEQIWRHPTYDEAAKIVERYHRWQDQNPSSGPTTDPQQQAK